MKNIIKKTSIAFLFMTVFAIPALASASYETYDDSYYTNYSYDDSYYTNYSYDDSYYTNYTYDDSYYTNYSYDDSYYTNYSYDDSYYTNYTYDQPYYTTYSTNSVVYETPYYGSNTNYYSEPEYNWYPTYSGYDDSYYGGSGCNSNCYNDYEPEPECRTNCNPPQYDDLDVICIVSDRTIEEGESVTFEADVDGGKAPYTYRWTGDVSSNNRSVTTRFNQEGTYEATVRVTDSRGRTATANCDVTVEEEEEDEEDFDAICVPSDRTIREGERVTFTAEVEGGDRPYEYDWSGDADGDDREISVRFNREGRYEIDLEVTDDEGRTARDTCEIRVNEEDEDDDRDVNVSTGTYTSGGNPTVGSVYLNQVPYTGPEEVAKGVAFATILLAWSIATAMIIRNRMNKNTISKRIANFKEANKAAQI